MQSRRLWSGNYKDKEKEEDQREVGRIHYERKFPLLGKHREKLNNSARSA
jgi:hypothetical protein